jgi:L-threonylcarbamoyladenylate synthase
MTGSNAESKSQIAPGADPAVITRAVAIVQDGGLVALPTETVYGLAADASNAHAVAAIYRVKGRPDFNPLIVHVRGRDHAEKLAYVPPLARALAARFWPGPLTLVLPLRDGAPVAPAVTAGLATIALRCPAHPVMQAVLQQSGLALAAPSANASGRISPTCAAHVAASLPSADLLIVDGGACAQGIESTIVDCSQRGWRILRPGPITAEQLAAATGEAEAQRGPGAAAITAPGQLASHYAPSKPVRLAVVQADPGDYHIGFGVVGGDDNLSAAGDPAEAAAQLFAALHRADASDRRTIAIAPIPNRGIGAAINDRLRRAATC